MIPPKLNLFQIARENAKGLEKQLADAISRCDNNAQVTINEFTKWLFDKASVSINLPPYILAHFIQNRTYYNIHEWSREQEALSGRPREACLREKLGTYYDRRMLFDGAFQNGEQFRYGTLNAGGPGLVTKFGMFCIVLDKDFLDDIELAYLKDDSLFACFNARGEVDWLKVGSIVAPHSHRHVLAAIKHFDVIPTTSDKEWARHILNDNSYIEAVFTEPFSREDIHKIRVMKDNYDELWNLAFSDFGMKLTGADKALVSDFTTIVKGNKQGLFVLEVLSP